MSASIEEKRRALIELQLRQRRQQRAERERIRPAPRDGRIPPSYQQEGLWFLDQLAPGATVYNVPSATLLRGPLDVAALRGALTGLVVRHEGLRTRFGSEAGEPFQIIDPPPEEVPLPVIGAADIGEARALAEAEARRPFDLARGPLLRCELLRLAEDSHVLLLSLHHIISDGWSVSTLTRELAATYAARCQGRPAGLPPLPIQPADHAAWQRRWLAGDVLRTQLGYWREQLADLPVVDLVTDHPRPSSRTWAGDTVACALPSGLGAALAALAAEEQVPLLAVLLAAFLVVLHRHSGRTDLAVGSVVGGRSRPEMEPLVGFFANTLVLRTDIGGDPAFRELVRRCGGTVLGALAHQDVPFGRLVDELRPDRDPARNPLFQISFTLQAGNTAGGQFELPGLTAEPIDTARSNSRFDLGLTVIAHDNGPFEAQLEYSTELFGRGRVVGLVEHFRRVLEEVVADPGVRVGRLDVLTEGERGRLVGEWNPVPHRFATEGLLLHRLVPADERPAVRFAGRTLTYAELGVRSDRLASVLAARGVGPDVVVGVLLERGFDLPVAQLGVLKAGGAWVPLDPAHPVGRLAFQISDTGAPLVVTTSGLADRLPAGVPRICLDDPGSLDGPGTAPEVGTRPDDAAYVIYTSGSTGTPKGVVVSHRSVVNFVSAIGELFSIGRQDRVLQFANPSFDVSIFDFYAALCRGATVVAAPRSVLLEPDALTGLMASEGVTIADIPPAVLGLLSPGDLPGLRVLWVGLEAFPADLVNAWNRGSREFHNGYGPTEATVACVDYRCPPGVMAGKPPIGRPMANHRVYVLNDDLRLVPPGVPGELFVAGAGLARGYLNQPALTAERFLPDPFGPAPGGRMYRTGDVVRWREDGLLEFLGRADRQVKIRGLRIELTEIEHVLSAQPGIRQAAVTVHDQAQLVGYVVSDAQPDEALLREALARQLPLHMVPATIMFLDTLPLTTSGKLDHSKLPPPAAPQDRPRVPPRTHAEAAIARIWASILNLPAGELSTQDSFFALGGNSLHLVRLLSRIRDDLHVELDLRTLFTNPVLHQLATVLDEAQRRDTTDRPITPVPRDGRLPLSHQQEGLWFLDRLTPGSPVYNMPYALRLRGRLDEAALLAALTGIVARHEGLRTRFGSERGTPFQIIDPVPDHVPLPVTGAADIGEARALAEDEARTPFDLARGPLLRARLLRLATDDHVLLLTIHHIVTDGWSNAILTGELAELYQGRYLPPLAAAPADVAVWQRDRDRAGHLAHWQRVLDQLPVVDFPADRPRPAVPTWAGASLERDVAGLGAAAQEFAAREQVSLLAVLLAGLATVFSAYTGEHDLPIGSVLGGRTRPEIEPLVGFFATTVVLRTNTGGDPRFRDLVRRCHEVVLDATAHQDVPFGTLVDELRPDRDPARNPLFQVCLNLLTADTGTAEFAFPGLAVEPLEQHTDRSRFDLTASVLPLRDGTLRMQVEYASELFDEARIQRFTGHWAHVLAAALAAPDTPVADLPLLGPAEHTRLAEWNETGADLGPDVLLDELFEPHAGSGAVAVRFADMTLTHAELHRRANRLAHHLVGLGVGPDVPVGVCARRSPDLVVALLAVLKAGGAYLPIDPALPAKRVEFLLADTRAPVVLADPGLCLPPADAHVVNLAQERDGPDTRPVVRRSPSDLAYIMYTSGSTGVPKGVLVEHQSVVNWLRWMQSEYRLRPRDVVLLKTPFTFDVSVREIFWPLLVGARMVVAKPDGHWDSRYLAELIRREQVTVAHFVPSMLHAFLADTAVSATGSLRMVMCSGEALLPDLRDRFFDLLDADLHNLYGPTETTVEVTYWPCRPEHAGQPVPIGRPVANTRCHVLDAHGRPAPAGVPGELHIGGVPVARGYLNRPELTAERFVPDPFGPPGARLYRTGDVVRWRQDGALEYLGRGDGQVKVRGVRIELGEVEHALRGHPAVADAVVTVHADTAEPRLVAYLVPAAGATDVTDAALREHVASLLPLQLIPATFVRLAALPLTSSGKHDRAALPAPASVSDPGADAGGGPPRTPAERALADIWHDLLGVSPGRGDGFFAVGGSSLHLIRLIAAISATFGVDLDPRTLYLNTTIEAIAALVASRTDQRPDGPAQPSSLLTISPHGAGEPCFLVHAVGGSTVPYLPFGDLLDRPVHALESPGHRGGTPVADLLEMARRYVAEVRRLQSHGPYLLGGWSLGGVIAVEMARLLLADGQAVAPVALLDSGVPPGQAEPPPRAGLLRSFGADLAGIAGLPAPDTDATDVDALLPALEDAGLLPRGLRAEARIRIATYLANATAFQRHRCAPLEVSVLLVRAADDHDEGLAARWAAVALGGVQEHVVPGTHYTMMRGDRLAPIAGFLEARWTLR